MRIKPLLLLTLIGCGGTDPIDFVALPNALQDAQCAFQVECEGMPDIATCRESLLFDDGEIGTIDAAIEGGTVAYDGEAAAACVDRIRGQGCRFPGFHIANPCADMFTGLLQEGEACIASIECEGSGICEETDINCDRSIACCPGTCVGGGIVESPIGGPCEDDDECALQAYCDFPDSPDPGVCTALVATEGAACDELSACVNPMICELDFMTQPFVGTCETPAATGQSCDPDALIACNDARDFCDAAGTCVAAVDVGSACSPDIACIGFASCVNSLCVADPSIGDPCTDTGPNCLASLECNGTTCVAPPSGPTCE